MSTAKSGFGIFVLIFILAIAVVGIMSPKAPSTSSVDEAALAEAREATGGAQTRESIMARQRGENVDLGYRAEELGNPENAAAATALLGTRGGVSDSDMFRALRYSEADVTTQVRAPAADVLIQDSGMTWLTFREGPLSGYGGGLMLGMVALLVLFYLLRGKIMIDGEKTGQTILRFAGIERFAHWLLAVSFVLLGITGLYILFGRSFLIPLVGHEAYSALAVPSKWIHNNASWAFMLALVMVFFMWVWHNIPNRTDLTWIAQGGGIFAKGKHPPAKKFNFGQKIIFWSVIVLGVSISLSGLSLLFPFELPMFAKTFVALNATGIPQAIGLGTLPETLLPHQEMQFAQAWHTIVAFVFMAIIIAHIYIGSVGMEGAFDAMGSGHVETQWAKEHHSLWYNEHLDQLDQPAKDGKAPQGTPAE